MFGGTTAVGIDIGEKRVRAALLERKGKTLKVRSLIDEPYGDNALEEALHLVKKRLKAVCKVPWQWPKHQILGVPQSHVAVKRFSLERDVPEHEQYIQIGLQLSENLGLPLNELLYDFHPLPDGDSAEVYACRKPLLDSTLKGLASSGYELSVVEMQTHALMRLYRHCASVQRGSLAAMLLDVGDDRVQLCIGKGGNALFYRELPLPFSADMLQSDDAQSLCTKALVDIVQRQYQLAAPQLQGAGLSGVWVSGSEVAHIAIPQLGEKLGWPAYVINPFNGLSYSASMASRSPESVVAWSTSIGLALRGIENEH